MKGVLFVILSLVVSVLCDIEITAPKSGKTYEGGDKIKLEWKVGDDDGQFALKKAKVFSISLCAGSPSNIECFEEPLKKWSSIDDDTTSYTAEIDSDYCDDGHYYFQVYIGFGEDIYVIHYSNMFELKDMKGDNELSISPTYTGDEPPGQTRGAAASNYDSASFSITYTKQTGLMRFAPMQMQPGSKVTATEWKRLFPTSDVTYYSTIRESPNHLSTITPGWSYTIKSAPNYASVAPTPSVRYNPKERVTAASLSSASKKRRWLD